MPSLGLQTDPSKLQCSRAKASSSHFRKELTSLGCKRPRLFCLVASLYRRWLACSERPVPETRKAKPKFFVERRYQEAAVFWPLLGDVISNAYARVSRDRPMLKAFCRVAPSVRFSFFAILPAGVFFRASDLSVCSSLAVQLRLLEPFFTISFSFK
jgi:hypothetical protein